MGLLRVALRVPASVPQGWPLTLSAGMREAATSLAVSPDGATIAAGSEDGSVRVWDIGKAQQMACLVGHQVSRGATCRE